MNSLSTGQSSISIGQQVNATEMISVRQMQKISQSQKPVIDAPAEIVAARAARGCASAATAFAGAARDFGQAEVVSASAKIAAAKAIAVSTTTQTIAAGAAKGLATAKTVSFQA